MFVLRRPLAVLTMVALVATMLVHVTAPPAGAAENVFIRQQLNSNGNLVNTYRIEVPTTTVERWEENVITEGSLKGATNCIHQVYRVLDTEYLAALPHGAWTGYPDTVPGSIGWYNPRSPDSYGGTPVVDMAELSSATGYDFGSGLGIMARSFATTLFDGCSQYRTPLSELRVPVVGVRNHGADLQVEIEEVAGQANTWRFTASAQHPIIGDLPLEFDWQFERFDRTEGATVTHTFTSEDETSFWHRHWQVWVTTPDVPNAIDETQGHLQSLGVELTRDGAGSVLVGEEFDIDLTLSAPADSPSTLTGVAPVGSPLTLPDWLEVVALPDWPEAPATPEGAWTGFGLAPGEQRTGTFTLRATSNGDDQLVARWTGANGAGQAIEGSDTLPVMASGTFEGDWFRLDPASEGVKQGETAPVRVRVGNITDRDLSDVELVDATVTGIGDMPGEAVLASAAEPHDGQDELLRLPDGLTASGPTSVGFADFSLEGIAEGDVLLEAVIRGTTPDGDVIEGTIEEEWVVRATDLTVEIEFDPEDRVQTESDDPEADPEPVEMAATVTLTNTSGGKLTDIRIEEFELSRLLGEQQLWVEQVGGQRLTNWDAPGILLEEPTGTDEPLEPFDLEDGEEEVFTADFVVRDDGQLDFHVLALGADQNDRTVRGYGENSWVLSPEKYLEVTTDVAIPEEGELLEAGRDVYITGRVVNLSQTASLEVGPLIPIPSGNTGQLSLAYGVDDPPDPRELPGVPGMLELGPGDSEVFAVRVATGMSDPRTNVATGEPETAPSGGTRAYFEFDPWAIATEADGTVRTVRTDPQSEEDRGVKITEEDREFSVSIDDSIAIPETEYVLLAGGITTGVVKGIGRAGVGLVVGAVETVKLPFTLSSAAMEFQSRVWQSYTLEERLDYSADFGSYLLAMARGNVDLGLEAIENTPEVASRINDMVFQEMTRLANEWETGDYVSTAEAYAAGGTEIAASLWLPAAMTKLAQAPRAAAAIERAQLAINARMGPIFAEARTIRYVEEALPLLRALENGAELTADVMWELYGVTPDEVAELQRLAAKYDVLLTFRSRHPSSVAWIRKFGAMMKPEAIKIKSVSEMDVSLGYRQGDLGSVVFRKPDVLNNAPADGVAFLDHVQSFVTSKGFTPGTKDFDSAVDRVKLRVKEWHKHEAEYRGYDQRRSIPTDFNYEGNAIRTEAIEGGRRQTGFKLEETGRGDEWVIKLQDPTDGKYKRVTGDIDPIAFTNLDGSPLTQAQHRDLINDMRASELLRAQHPESATFTGYVGGRQVAKPGLNFIEKQFKPLEAAAQIGPTGPARAVRLNKGHSRWDSVRDYNLHWEGGYKHAGGRGKIDQRTDFDPDFGRDVTGEVPTDFDFKPVQLGELGEAGLGRATLQAVKTGTGTAVFVGEGGQLIEVNPDGSTQPWEGGADVFEEGEPITLEIAPAGQVESTVTEVQGAAVLGLFGGRQFFAAPASPAADGVVLVDDGAPMLFEPGQVVAVGVQDGQGDLRTIAEVDGRTLLFAEPVAAAADDIVVMLQPAPADAAEPPGDGGEVDEVAPPAGEGEVQGAPVVRDDLPAAGADASSTLRFALGLLLLGAVLLRGGRLRREELSRLLSD